MRIRALAVSFFLLSAALVTPLGQSAQLQPDRRSPAWTAVDCSVFKVTAGSDVECGYVTAPLRHAEPGGPTIQLATVILPSIGVDRRGDPLFMAQGGPGGSTIDTYAMYLLNSPSSRPATNRDIVLWDQRGTLFSKPALMCPEVSKQELDAALTNSQESDAAQAAAYRACGERLAKEAGDLSAFNTAENADDVEDVRVALGYEDINFYGVSYGTELGQFLMRQHPEHLRSVVLDAVVPLTYNLFTEPAFAQQRIAAKYLGGCAADARCDTAFPNLTARYLAMIDRLNANPVTLQVRTLEDIAAGRSYPVKLTGTLLEDALYQSLYSDVYQLVPLIIDRADRGDFTFVSALILPLALFDTTMATGMHQTVACTERGDTDPDAADYTAILPRLAKETRDDAREDLAICKEWQIALLPRTALEPLTSAVPTLLLSGDFDPITPPQYAASLVPALSNAKHVIFPTGSHGQAITSACSNEIIQRFLDDPMAALDTSCVTTLVPGFLTEQDLITVPALRRSLASYGLAGLIVTLLKAAPGFAGVLVLLTSLLFYPIGGMIGWFRHRPPAAESAGLARTLSRVAPWVAAAAAVVLGVFFAGLLVAIAATIATNQNLIALGAIPSQWRWLFTLPPAAAILVAIMCLAVPALWFGRHRSVIGRLYYTLLAICGAIAVVNLVSFGVMGLWRG